MKQGNNNKNIDYGKIVFKNTETDVAPSKFCLEDQDEGVNIFGSVGFVGTHECFHIIIIIIIIMLFYVIM